MDSSTHEFVFNKCWRYRWRYRWAKMWFALRVLWNAVRGYELTVECCGCPTNE